MKRISKKKRIARAIANGIRKVINVGLALASLYGIFLGFNYIEANEYTKGTVICAIGLIYISVFLKMNPHLQNLDE